MNKESISYQNFNRLFNYFEIRYKEEFDEDFKGFDTGTMLEWEDFKPLIAPIAKELLAIEKWNSNDIGSGKILNHIISALRAKDPSGIENKLVYWMDKDNFESLIEKNNSLKTFEQLAYELFNKLTLPEESFEGLTKILGKKYSIIAYLFFIQDSKRYLPISPNNFDTIFKELGINFRTSGQASWENYQDYLSIIEKIQEHLIEMGYPDTRFIDAHSFCWVASYFIKEDRKKKTLPKKYFQKREEIQKEILENISSNKPDLNKNHNPAAPDKDKMIGKHRNNILIGEIAEERVFEDEIKELCDAGRTDLAEKVEWTSKIDMHAGYDIHSFEIDGSDRFIEVKASSGNRNQFSFIVSDPEFRMSRQLPNYFFYCLLFNNSKIMAKLIIPAEKIDETFLQPLNYRAYIKR